MKFFLVLLVLSIFSASTYASEKEVFDARVMALSNVNKDLNTLPDHSVLELIIVKVEGEVSITVTDIYDMSYFIHTGGTEVKRNNRDMTCGTEGMFRKNITTAQKLAVQECKNIVKKLEIILLGSA